MDGNSKRTRTYLFIKTYHEFCFKIHQYYFSKPLLTSYFIIAFVRQRKKDIDREKNCKQNERQKKIQRKKWRFQAISTNT